MKWRSASSAGQFWLLNQTLTLDQVAEFRRTRRVKEGTGSSASVSAAFGPVGPIHLGNPGLIDIAGPQVFDPGSIERTPVAAGFTHQTALIAEPARQSCAWFGN